MRAPGLQLGNPSGEIIDLLDGGSDAFPERAPTPDDDGDGRWRRWLAPMGGVAVVGLIAYAIASSSSHPSNVADTTVATSTTVARRPLSTATPVPAEVHFYAADPQGYILQSASLYSGLGSDNQDANYSYQRWTATADASAPGSWFSIETYPSGGPSPANGTNAYRVDLYGRAIAVSHVAFQTIAADFSASPTVDVRLMGVGLNDGQILQLVGAVNVQGGTVLLDNPNAYAGYERSTTVAPWFAIARTPVVQADYGNAASGRSFQLTVGRIDPGFDGGVQLSDRSSALRHSVVHTTSFIIDGHVAVAGQRLDAPDASLVTWMVGDDVITLTGLMPTSELISIARTVHEVSASDWNQRMQDGSQQVSLASQRSPTIEEGTFMPIAGGQFTNGEPWFVQAAWTTRGDQTYVSWMWPGPDGGNMTMLLTSNVPQLTDELDGGITYMLATLPRTYSTNATLHIDRPGMEPIAVPFVDPGPDFDRTLAAYAFTEPGMFTAWIESNAGSILATWPS